MVDEREAPSESRELVEREVFLANVFITPFAAAVAAELEEFGLSKPKIDEILLGSARRFGELRSDTYEIPNNSNTTDSEKVAGMFAGFFSAGEQLFGYIWEYIPRFAVKVAPALEEALVA